MRLGIIGPGLIWQKKHKAALATLSTAFSITAFCASSDRHKLETLRDFPQAAFETDLERFVKRGDIDAVVVLTPIHLNARATLLALRSGKDVFLEKPMANSLQAGRDVLETSAQTGRRVWVLEHAVYAPILRDLKSVIEKNLVGAPVYFDQVVHWPMDSGVNDRGGYGKTEWRIQPDFPLGLFFDGGVHQIAILSSLFGTPDWVFANGTKLRSGFGDYDHIVVQFGYSSQLKGVLSHSSQLWEKHNGFTLWGTMGSITIGEDSLLVDSSQGENQKIDIPRADAHDEMWNALSQSAATGKPPFYTLAHAWNDLSTMISVDQSIKTGQKINVEVAG